MATKTAVALCDIDKIKPIVAELKKCEDIVTTEKQRGAGAVLRTGAAAQRAQALLAKVGCKSKFSNWCDQVGLSRTTAYAAISAYEAFGKCPTVGQFEAGALYALSARNVSPAARSRAVLMSSQGKLIRTVEVRKMLKELPGPSSNGSAKSAKGPSFDPAKLDGQKPSVDPMKQAKPGRPIVAKEDRDETFKSLGKLIRQLKKIGLYEEFSPALSQIDERIRSR